MFKMKYKRITETNITGSVVLTLIIFCFVKGKIIEGASVGIWMHLIHPIT